MQTLAELPTTTRMSARHHGHARNQSKRYGQVLDTSTEYLTLLPESGPSTPPPLSPTPSAASSSSSAHSSPYLTCCPPTPTPLGDAHLNRVSVAASEDHLGYPHVLIHTADNDEGATLEEIRAMGAFWKSLGGKDEEGAALLAADAPGDKYRSLIAALNSPPPFVEQRSRLSEASTYLVVDMAADELPVPVWDLSSMDVEEAEFNHSRADTSTSCDAIDRVLAELEADAPSTSALAELSMLKSLDAMDSRLSSPRSPKRRPGVGRSTASAELSFSAWVEVGEAADVSHRHSGKLVKDQQAFAKGHRKSLSAAMSMPDLKAQAKTIGRKLSRASIKLSKDDSGHSISSSHRKTLSHGVRQTLEPIFEQQAGPSSQNPASPPIASIDESALDTSSALDRLELSLAKLDVSVHNEETPTKPSAMAKAHQPFTPPNTRPFEPEPENIRVLPATVPARRPCQAKPSFPTIPWELYDPHAPRAADLLALPPCPSMTPSTSAPSALGLLSLNDDDPFAVPYLKRGSHIPTPSITMSYKSSVTFASNPTSIPKSGSRALTPSPPSSFVMLPRVPPMWTVDEFAPPPEPRVPDDERMKDRSGSGLLRKAVRKAGMVGWWGKQKSTEVPA